MFYGKTVIAFPRVGKVAPQATDEGETGERDRITQPSLAFPPGWWKKICKQFSASAPDEGENVGRTLFTACYFLRAS